MIITNKFCWGHLGKTGGDSTKTMFDILELKDIILSHEVTDPNKHLNFRKYPDLCKDKKKILNIRRLATWIISDWNHFYRAKQIEQISKKNLVKGLACRVGKEILADQVLKNYACEELGGIDYWLRTEYLAEDFIKVMENFEEISEEKKARIRQVKENQAKNRRNVRKLWGVEYSEAEEILKKFFTREEVKNMYERNPFWSQIEKEMYGNLLYEELELDDSEKKNLN